MTRRPQSETRRPRRRRARVVFGITKNDTFTYFQDYDHVRVRFETTPLVSETGVPGFARKFSRTTSRVEHPSSDRPNARARAAGRSARGAKRDVERGGRAPSVRRGGGDGAAAGADGGGASARGRATGRDGKEPVAVPPSVRQGRVRVVPRAHRDRVHGHGRRRAGAERHRRARGAGAGQHELDPEPGGPGGPAPRRAPRRGENGKRASQRGVASAPAGGSPARRARGGGARDRVAAPVGAGKTQAQGATGGGAGGDL